MNKSDLKVGMTLVYRNGSKVDYYKGYAVDFESEGIMKMDVFNEDLTHKEHEFWDVCKIIEDDFILWERDETDWSKIPFGTKVICWNDEDTVEYEGKFLEYDEEQILYKYLVYVKGYTENIYKYCKLAEEPKVEVTYNEMMKSIDKICDKNYKKNKTCYGCMALDSNGLCNRNPIADENFTITRK